MPGQLSAMNTARNEPRRRASLACQNCRQRKVKCDAQNIQPGQQCTPCQRTKSHCVINRSGDRRKSGSRKHIETLEQRIHSLEALLTQNSGQNVRPAEAPPGSIHDMSPVEEITEEQDGINMNPTNFHFPITNPDVAGNAPQDCISPQRIPWLESDLSMPHVLPLNSNPDPSETASEGGVNILGGGTMWQGGTPSDSSREHESQSRRSSRSREEGSCALGPTSQPHLLSPLDDGPIPSRDELSDVGIEMDINSVQLRNRLLQSFFRYQTLWVSVIDENLFHTHRKSGVSSFWYSPFLETVMLACAARLSTSSAVRSLGRKYASQAHSEIVYAIEKPSAASLQGFLLLSEYEVTHGHDRIGWMLCGMASRMLVDIGSHEPIYMDCETRSLDSQGALLHLLCATVSYEGIWCMYLGRPSAISRPVVKAAALECRNYKGHECNILTAWMELCVPMAEICDILNSAQVLGPAAKAALFRLELDLQKWCDSLPPGMAYDEHSLPDLDPTAYGIHMQFCKVQILIHKALLQSPATEILEDIELPEQANITTRDESEQIIYENAIQIIRLLLTYRQIEGTEKIPSVMLDNVNLALTVLVTKVLKQPSQITMDSRDIQWIRLTVSIMEALQSHFPIIRRMLYSLQPMVDGTVLGDLFPTKTLPQQVRLSASPPIDTNVTPVIQKFMEYAPKNTAQKTGCGNELSNILPLGEPYHGLGCDQLTEQVQSQERNWIHQDPEELTSSLLSWPNLRLASLWIPQPTTVPGESNG